MGKAAWRAFVSHNEPVQLSHTESGDWIEMYQIAGRAANECLPVVSTVTLGLS